MGRDLSSDWRTVAASVAGSAHAAAGEACADACVARVLSLADGKPVLFAAVADGAGSAARGGEGAQLALAALADVVEGWALHSLGVSGLDEERARDWLDHVRDRIDGAARLDHGVGQDFAATLLLALVDADSALFLQVGDGAIVYRAPQGAYVPALWPQLGEYANATWFVTDPLSSSRAQLARVGRVDELALLSDGLQSLALHFASREAHAPFFAPMFAQLRSCPEPRLSQLEAGLREFLGSDAVNARTDDDKTLVLAARLAAAA